MEITDSSGRYSTIASAVTFVVLALITSTASQLLLLLVLTSLFHNCDDYVMSFGSLQRRPNEHNGERFCFNSFFFEQRTHGELWRSEHGDDC